MSIIEWDENGYPTEESLERLRTELESWQTDWKRAIRTFYQALSEPGPYGACGFGRIEVRGELCDVWGYHTGGWSGNEAIVAVLQSTPLWDTLLERYDRGGHYYFDPPWMALNSTEKEETRDG